MIDNKANFMLRCVDLSGNDGPELISHVHPAPAEVVRNGKHIPILPKGTSCFGDRGILNASQHDAVNTNGGDSDEAEAHRG